MNFFDSIRLVVGLGNQGSEYAGTFHNTGILAVEYLSQKEWAGVTSAPWESVRNKHFRFIRGHGGMPTLVIPTGFMNESGCGVKNALDYFDLIPQNLLVVHDDADLPLGELKISKGQGTAGHKGAASVIEYLGTKDFYRARIGIRSEHIAAEERQKAEEFVLKKISSANLDVLTHVFEKLRTDLGTLDPNMNPEKVS